MLKHLRSLRFYAENINPCDRLRYLYSLIFSIPLAPIAHCRQFKSKFGADR